MARNDGAIKMTLGQHTIVSDTQAYRDVILAYLEEALPQAMTPSVKQSWHAFLTTLCDGLVDALDHLEEQRCSAPSQARRNALTSSWVEVRH